LEESAATVGVAAPRCQLFEIVAGAEGGAVRRDDDGANSAILPDRNEAFAQCGEQRHRQAVARLRAGKRQYRDVGHVFAQQDRSGGRGGRYRGVHRGLILITKLILSDHRMVRNQAGLSGPAPRLKAAPSRSPLASSTCPVKETGSFGEGTWPVWC